MLDEFDKGIMKLDLAETEKHEGTIATSAWEQCKISGSALEVVFPEGKQGQIVFLKVFADESYDSKVYCCGALLGWPKSFYYLGLKWNDRLEREGLKYFHASEHVKLVELREDLVKIIQSDSSVAGSSFSIVKKDFAELVRTDSRAKKLFGTDPMVCAYKTLVKDMVTLMEKDFPNPPVKIAFVFDGHSNWKKAEKAYRELSEDPACAHRILSVTHADDKDFPALQMADLMAYEARIDTGTWLAGTTEQRTALEALKRTHSIYFMGVRDKAHLLLELDKLESQQSRKEAGNESDAGTKQA
jgi:hypothetical protein